MRRSTDARPSIRRRSLIAGLLAAGCSPRIVPAGPAIGQAVDGGDALVMEDGVRLPLSSWLPEAPPRGVIIGLHGFNDYRGAFEIPSPLFTEAGWALYAYDQRGFGATPDRGLWPGADTLASDATAAAALIRARHPGLPLVMIGESMGGAVLLVAGTRIERPAADGFVLSAPAVWGGETMGEMGRFFIDLFAHTMPALGIVGGSPYIRASDNEEALRAMGRDPMMLRSTRVDALYGLVALMDAALAAAPAFEHPALVLHGERDDIVPRRAIEALRQRLPGLASGRQRFVAYANGYHLLLRDLSRAEVAADILAWAGNGTLAREGRAA